MPATRSETTTGATAVRLAVFLVVAVAVMAWVAAGDNQYASAARSFLKQLFRQMF